MLKFIENKLNNGEDVILTFIGDSITYGCDHCTADETYCAFVSKFLAEKFPMSDVVRYDGRPQGEFDPLGCYDGPFVVHSAKGERHGSITVIRCGIGGNTVRRAVNRAEDYCGPFVKGRVADIYFTMFGINDALKNDPRKYITPDKFEEDYRELCSIIKEAAPDSKLVLMTPTYNDLGDSDKSHLEPYCDVVKFIAKEFGAHLIDLHKLWMNHLIVGTEHYGQRDWLSAKVGDSCHFSPAGSLETAKFIVENMNI